MEIESNRWIAVGGVHRIPVGSVEGSLYLCGLDAIGGDPAALLDHVSAETVVCLQTDAEIDRRYPAYLRWLGEPDPHEALRLPTEDHLVADDGPLESLVEAILSRLRGGESVVVQCGAGWGRAGLVAALVMMASGAELDDALRDLRDARPAAGPQSAEQHAQLARLGPRLRDQASL